MSQPAPGSGPPSAPLALVLSVAFPGLGHLYAGSLPGAVLWVVLTAAALHGGVALLFLPGVIWGVIYGALLPFVTIAMLHSAWRAAAGADAGTPRFPWWAYAVFIAAAVPARAAVAPLVRGNIGAPFTTPSAGMVPTLLVGDSVVTRTGRDPGPVERGQLITFRSPPDPSSSALQRVIGLPGETVEIRDDRIYLDGAPVPQTRGGAYTWRDGECQERGGTLVTETLGERQVTALLSAPGPLSNHGPVTVPDGHYFVMGDNRGESSDSRVWGAVAADQVTGRPARIWLSSDPCGSPFAFRWDRLGALP